MRTHKISSYRSNFLQYSGLNVILYFLWVKNGGPNVIKGVTYHFRDYFTNRHYPMQKTQENKKVYTKIDYSPIKAGEGQKHSVLKEVKDASKELGVEQCKVYSPSEGGKTCVIYMNYGGWNVQDDSMGQQVYDFCEKEGYSFIRFAKARGEGQYCTETIWKNII